MSQREIVMLGHGEIGRALESALVPKSRISIWERDLDTWEENVPLEELLEPGCDLILFALPTSPHQEIAERVHQAAPHDVPCLTIAKGLDAHGHSPAYILKSVFKDERQFGVLYGPMIAENLLDGLPGFAVVASKSEQVISLTLELFAGSHLHVAGSGDVMGASWAVILKNVYVPLLGAAEQLGLGDNIRGFLIAAALKELSRIVQRFDGKAETVYGLPGAGDLITTATSPGSHHRNAGMQLAAGQTEELLASGTNIRGEGFHALKMLAEHKMIDFDEFPVISAMRDLLDKPENARAIILKLCENTSLLQ
jgi:glycerol-3-phosphate dehydrogenase (NAD(P)+)